MADRGHSAQPARQRCVFITRGELVQIESQQQNPILLISLVDEIYSRPRERTAHYLEWTVQLAQNQR
jgi:hypothetical protein